MRSSHSLDRLDVAFDDDRRRGSRTSYGVGLNHLPSGRFGANGAWLSVPVIAHNLARWTARLGLGAGIVTTKTLRRRLFAVAGRLTRSARRVRLHLPARWPWAIEFSTALARLRAIPLLALPPADGPPAAPGLAGACEEIGCGPFRAPDQGLWPTVGAPSARSGPPAGRRSPVDPCESADSGRQAGMFAMERPRRPPGDTHQRRVDRSRQRGVA